MILKPVLFIPDTHAPYHDLRAWKLVMKVARYYAPVTTIILGDFIDNYRISSYSKDPRRLGSLSDELQIAARMLRGLEAVSPKGSRIYVEGNHEYRLHRYLCDKAPEIYELVVAADSLGLRQHHWNVVPYKSDIDLGKIFITHDVGQAGIHSTRQAMHSYQDNVIIGHNHRMDYHVQANAKGVPHIGASFGWLGDVTQVDYMHQMKARSNWALGFGWARIHPVTKCVYVVPVPLVNYTCCVEGKYFHG